MLIRFLLLALLLPLGCSAQSPAKTSPIPSPKQAAVEAQTIFDLGNRAPEIFTAAKEELSKNWNNGLAVLLLEISPALEPQRRQEVTKLVHEKLGKTFPSSNEMYQWYWNQSERPPAWYSDFKARFYSRIDPSFLEYFDQNPKTLIDLTEIRWGGVKRDGIPPLDHPKMLPAQKATYLEDDNVVFGIIHRGDARAYPKRILAWHEMFRDEIGGDSIAGVYCTLCGTMIPYLSQQYIIGTSGFLYRSNKLMYDMKTRSLWSTTDGTPVVGPLVGQDIKLKSIAVVTTTWGEWRRRHPETTVLSLDTGHRRDYGEGVAYHDYFATDELMFNTPQLDERLANKAEVLVLGIPGEPLALDSDFLKKNPVYQDKKANTSFVVLTDATGANRVYESQGQTFSDYSEGKLRDSSGAVWTVEPDRLHTTKGESLARLPAHRAFWFGWYAAHPNTRLVK